MARTRDPLQRLAKRDMLPMEVLCRASQSLFEDKLRFIQRVNELRFDQKPTASDPDAHTLRLSDTADVRLLLRLWLRYWALDDSEDDNIKACHEILNHIVKVTDSLMKQKMDAHRMVMDFMQHYQKSKEHDDKMSIATKTRPEDMLDATLESLADIDIAGEGSPAT